MGSFELPLSLFTSLFFSSSNIFEGILFLKDPVHKTESEGSGSKNKSNMKILQGVLVVALSLAGLTNGEDDGDLRVSKMDRQSLHEYTLAKCSDGSPAAYYIDEDASAVAKNVMIYFDNSVDSFKNPIQPCTTVDECLDICDSHPEACVAPIDVTRLQTDGVWSREKQNNPFADYYKIYLPSCTLDDFSGARGPLFGSQGGKIFFHGRHIFSALLRDLVGKYGIDQAESIILVGSGSGARGVGHGCDYLSEAIATVNEKASVKCVLDSPDLTPYWLNDEIAQQRCNETGSEAFIDEATKDLWGRTDDESCVRELEHELNNTLLASSCGMFSQYWKHVQTPMFIISSQWNEPDFNRVTCNVSQDDEDYFTYSTLWRQGIMTMVQVMSLEQPANGWFIPYCQDQTLFFADEAIEQRKNVKIPLFVTGEESNILNVLNNWLTKDIEDDKYQAIDQFGSAHEACSSELQSQRSQPLKKKINKKNAKQRIVPLDPLSEVPQPKGFPDGPPPRPSDPIDNLNLEGLLGKGVSESEIILAGELFKRQMAEKQRRRRPNAQNDAGNGYDVDFLYYLYRNRFQIPTDLLYYRYNAGRVPSRGTSTGFNNVFDPIDTSTPDIFDYDYDVNVNYDRPNGTPTPQLGVLPEQAVALANTKSRKARLWRKVYYLQYLRELYRKTYADYYNDYYYGVQGSGTNGRLTKSDNTRDE